MRATSNVFVSSRLAVDDEARLGRRAAHVEAQQAVLAEAPGEPAAGERAGGRARLDEADRRLRRRPRPTTTPPLDSIISTEPPKPSAASHFCSSSRYGPITGIVAALHAVVIIRGYSRICGEMSLEMHTGTPSARRRCSATARSLAGLA